jgi:hypothetical protein
MEQPSQEYWLRVAGEAKAELDEKRSAANALNAELRTTNERCHVLEVAIEHALAQMTPETRTLFDVELVKAP